MKRCFFVVFMLVLLPASNLSAQEAELSTYRDEAGFFSVAHPPGWVVDGGLDDEAALPGLFVAMAADPERLWNIPTEAEPGDAAMFFFVMSAEQFSADDTAAPETLAQAVWQFMTSDSELPIAPGDVGSIALESGIPAGRLPFKGGTSAGAMVVYMQDGYIIASAGLGHIDEFASFEPLALRILSTLEVDTARLRALSIPEAIPALEAVVDTSAPVRNVVIDADMAHEDMNAILYLLQHPNVDVRAITVSGTGEAHCRPGVNHALALVELSGSENIPVACGRTSPLVGEHKFPLSWRVDADRAYRAALPQVSGEAQALDASAVLDAVISSSPEKLTLVTLGPLTNIAEAFQQNRSLADNIDMIYMMGGAVDVPGNIAPAGVGIDNTLAEWNIYIDPHAANVVLNSGTPITLVPLDATQYVPVTMSFYRRLGQTRESPAAMFVYDVLTFNRDFIASGGFQFWDSLTAAIAIDEGLATFEMRNIRVVEDEGPESGYTSVTDGGAPVRVAVAAEADRFENMFLAVLNRVD